MLGGRGGASTRRGGVSTAPFGGIKKMGGRGGVSTRRGGVTTAPFGGIRALGGRGGVTTRRLVVQAGCPPRTARRAGL
jgi:hypothetical protein